MMKPPMPSKAGKGLGVAASKTAGTPAAGKMPAFKKGGKVAGKGKLPPWLAGKTEAKGSSKTPFMKKGGKVCK
jgi:hypothetical protein